MYGRNVEFKTRLPNLGAARLNAAWLGAVLTSTTQQTDTYFNASNGRLKLREEKPGGAELIAYQRPAQRGGKGCDYRRTPVADPAECKAVLEAALGVRAVVRKTRELWVWENTRIHLDTVEGLGPFIEFEVVVGPEHPEEECRRTLAAALDRFGLSPLDGIALSYAEMK